MKDIERAALPATTYRLPGGVTYAPQSSTSSVGWLELEHGNGHFPLAYGREDVLRALLTGGESAIPALRASNGETLAQVMQAVGNDYDWDRARDAYLPQLSAAAAESLAAMPNQTEIPVVSVRSAVPEPSTAGLRREPTETDYLKSAVRWAIDRVDGDVFDELFFQETDKLLHDAGTIDWMREQLEIAHPSVSFVEPTGAQLDDDWDDDSRLAFTTWSVRRGANRPVDTAYVFSFEHAPTEVLWTMSSERDAATSKLLSALATSLEQQGRRIESGSSANTLRQALKSTTGYDPELGL